jgi:hypothetical protein
MKFKQIKHISVGFLLVLLTSCSGLEETMKLASEQTKNARENFERKNPESNISNNSNIVKVLNRVSCDDKETYCGQEKINYIWKECLKNGYTISPPNRQVVSSRDLKELVKEVGYIGGYCIGSEYITR